MEENRIPGREELCNYNYAVAGHAGTLCDKDGKLFIKPCTPTEMNFYQSALRNPEFADIMPRFMGSLVLCDPSDLKVDDAVTGIISDAGAIQTAKEQIEATVAEQVSRAPSNTAPHNGPPWAPTNGKKIKTDTAVVLENATRGFTKPNILDARFDKIASETTHGKLGFRIAGMRVFRGSDDAMQLDKEGYLVYDKDYGRTTMNNDNILDGFRNFIFNEAAGIDEDLGQAVCAAFASEVGRIQEILEAHETRMYSSSLLFIFEGDGEVLSRAIEKNNAFATAVEAVEAKLTNRSTLRTDSGIAMDDDDELIQAAVLGDDDDEDDDDDDDDDVDSVIGPSALPPVFSLKLIDFAHAQWTPGQGPDENLLKGHVESATRIVALRKAGEWRFHLAPGASVSVKLLSGTAEKDGVELAPRNAYKLSGPLRGKLLTWHG
ncbi:hypothetical protein LLEC1_07233, partial [Akanthomyces lecanii]